MQSEREGHGIGGRSPLPSGERVAAKRPGEGAFRSKPSPKTRAYARQMRKAPTDAESVLWYEIRNRQLNGYRFNRQVRIASYIIDFVCRGRNLIVELDGGQHCENARDERRTHHLNAMGYSVLRFWNDEVAFEREGVLDTILAVLEGHIHSPSPGLRFAPADLSPAGRGKSRRTWEP